MTAFAGEGPMPITWLTKVVDQLQRKGWDYYDTITSTRVVRPGCIGSLLGLQKSAPTDRILVFRRRRRSRSEPGSS